MESTEFLNETNYNRANKKIKRVSLIILSAGLLIGGGLIGFGIYKQVDADQINEERAIAAQAEVTKKVSEAKERLNAISTEMADLEGQLEAKNQECDSLSMQDADWFAKSSQCHREAMSIQSQINDLSSEQFQLENAHYTVYYDKVREQSYIPFYFVGGFVILAAGIASLSVWLITKRRAIAAYGVQSTMPVAHEALKKTADKLTPTASKAAGDIASSIAEGITRGRQKGQQ